MDDSVMRSVVEVLMGWTALSVPVALVFGRWLARASRPIPARAMFPPRSIAA